jgi:hypothetical protein
MAKAAIGAFVIGEWRVNFNSLYRFRRKIQVLLQMGDFMGYRLKY